MIITALETIRLPEHPNIIWVQVHTSEGLIGLGETYYIPAAVEAVIHDFAAPLLLGQSAFDREKHLAEPLLPMPTSSATRAQRCAPSPRWISPSGTSSASISGQPIYNLLGGQCRDSIRVYNTCVNTPLYADQDGFLQRPGELAESLLGPGHHADEGLALGPLCSPDDGRGLHRAGGLVCRGPTGHDISPQDLKQGLWTVQEIRKAVGNRMDIAIEGHSRWDLNVALRIARALEPYDVIWMEDIIQPDSVDDLARLVTETRVPQCVSERLFTKYAFREMLERGAAHIVMPDLIWTGGITETVKIATLADAYHMAIAPHDCTGPINVFACLHVCAALPNVMVMETVRGFHEGYYRDLVAKPLPVREGAAYFDPVPRTRRHLAARGAGPRRCATSRNGYTSIRHRHCG